MLLQIKLLTQMAAFIILTFLNLDSIHHGFLNSLGIQSLLMELYGQKLLLDLKNIELFS